jgi:Domain of unknown function (DUF4307)
VIAALAAVAIAGFLWLAWQQSAQTVSGQVTRYRVKSVHAIVVTAVIKRPDQAAARCTIRALAEDHSVVGQQTVVVDRGGQESAVITRLVRTSRAADSADLVDCRRA